jgi:hypothetical protein
MAGMSLHSVDAILILATDDGSRVFAKYYTPPHLGPGCQSSVPQSSVP